MQFQTLDDIREFCRDLPIADADAEAAATHRQSQLTKPAGSLGRLEDLAVWLARWQGRAVPALDHVSILVFAGNHGVVRHGVSAFPAEVTQQMVANFAAGGAAINQIATIAGARLSVVPIELDRPTADFTTASAMTQNEFIEAINLGFDAVAPDCDLVAVGEMGIGNTTSAAALCTALLGGPASRWTGRGTGVDDAGLDRKRDVIDSAIAHHGGALTDPLHAAMALGGRELAAIAGAVIAARHYGIPLLLDGFVATAAILPLVRLQPSILHHCTSAHVSAEAGHRLLLQELGLRPVLDLGMRLGEASGAATAILIVRAALACLAGMATFAQASVSGRDE